MGDCEAMEVKIFFNDSIEKNASIYFEKSKKAKKKLDGANKALANSRLKLAAMQKKDDKKLRKVDTIKPEVSEWYEKFRWFFTSDGKLVLGGRDAATNEIIIKKHTESQDLVFHTDMSGSPFFVLKEGSSASAEILKEVGDATCSFSKAWKLGLGTQSVFYVTPDQVTKTPKSGEYLTKGAFVIKGKTNYIENKINLAVGMLKDNRIMCAPLESVKANCEKAIVIIQGDRKTSEVAKDIKKKFNLSDLDNIIRILPTGSIAIKK